MLTVEGGQGDGRLAAELIIFRVGIRILGNGCDQRVWGVTRGCGICHQPGHFAHSPWGDLPDPPDPLGRLLGVSL